MNTPGLSADYLSELCALVDNTPPIGQDQFTRYNVKRGLRNTDGTGVLVGLTGVGEVHGYVIDENEKRAVEGVLRYCGISVEDLVEGLRAEERSGFEEVCYLLLFGDLPGANQLERFCASAGALRNLPEGFTENMILKAPSRDVMNKLARAVLASYSYDDNPDDCSVSNTIRQSMELLARFPTMIAYGYQAKVHYYDHKSLIIHLPDPSLSTAGNFLRMIRPDASFTSLEARALDTALILHAEHGGGNNSTFALRVVTSSLTDMYSAIATAVGSLKGPRHGGANSKVTGMMRELQHAVRDWNDADEIAAWLQKVLAREAFDHSGLIYGLGHAVYTICDPRTPILAAQAQALAKEKGDEALYQLYALTASIAPGVMVSSGKMDKPPVVNVDFYSGFVYQMLGIPEELFTPLFAMSRVAGWCAHRLEELRCGGKIIRPAYKSVCARRGFVPLAQRSGG